jgi:hypothetical protein
MMPALSLNGPRYRAWLAIGYQQMEGGTMKCKFLVAVVVAMGLGASAQEGRRGQGGGVVWSEPAPRARQIWDPAPASGQETVRSRIVHFRHSNCRGGTERERGLFGQRYVEGGGVATTWRDITNVDLNGNPSTADWIETIPFSLTEPLSPATPLWDNDWTRFFGGFTFYYVNRKPRDGGTTEKYVNSNESVCNQQPANDWALHHLPSKVAISLYRCYAAWIWKKEDFSSGADAVDAKVSFDKSSMIGLYTQRYWQNWEGIRFIVMDGDQLYVSEVLPNDTKESRGGSGKFQLRTLVPTESKWARWDPKEGDYRMEFDPKTPMEAHTFTDVRAVGWYLFKDTLDKNAVACKWESFECYANVTRPAQASILTDMREIRSKDGPAFQMATTECAYDLWRKVFQWSYNRGQWCL